MFTIENEYIVATFLHPNYEQLLGATSIQIVDCYHICCSSMLPVETSKDLENDADSVDTEIVNEPKPKRAKLLMTTLMDKNVSNKQLAVDKVDQYIKLQVDVNSLYTDPLKFGNSRNIILHFQIWFEWRNNSFRSRVAQLQLSVSLVLLDKLLINDVPI